MSMILSLVLRRLIFGWYVAGVYLIQTHFPRVFGKQETSLKVILTHFPRVFGKQETFIESDPNPFSKGIWEVLLHLKWRVQSHSFYCCWWELLLYKAR
jgi:hypothetical protein